MSIGIGFVGEGFSVTATDTRKTKIASYGYRKTGEYSDNAKKTFLTKFGWVSVTGGVSLSTRFFKENLELSGATETDDIYNAWLYSIKRTKDFAQEYVDEKTEKIVSPETATSTAICSKNTYESGEFVIGLDVMDFAFSVRSFNEAGTLFISNPIHNKKIVKLANKYGETIKIYKYGGLLNRKIIDSTHYIKKNNDIHYAIFVIASLIDDVSKVAPWVSGIANMGICYKLSPDEILLMYLNGSTEELKKIYGEKQDYSEIMMVCGVLNGKPERMVTHG